MLSALLAALSTGIHWNMYRHYDSLGTAYFRSLWHTYYTKQYIIQNRKKTKQNTRSYREKQDKCKVVREKYDSWWDYKNLSRILSTTTKTKTVRRIKKRARLRVNYSAELSDVEQSTGEILINRLYCRFWSATRFVRCMATDADVRQRRRFRRPDATGAHLRQLPVPSGSLSESAVAASRSRDQPSSRRGLSYRLSAWLESSRIHQFHRQRGRW